MASAGLYGWLFVAAGLGPWCAWPAEGEGPTDVPSGPEQLKARKQTTVVTVDAPTDAVSTTNAPAPLYDWDFRWKAWDGIHFELTRKTYLGTELTDLAHLPVLRLDETRMAGKLGAKFALDAAAFVADDAFDDFDNGAELRRARLYARGDCLLVLPVSYELEIGYIPGQFYIENTFLEFHQLGILGSLKGGQFQVPMSMVNYGSSRDMMFMEPASVLQAIAPGVNAGLQLGRPVFADRLTWALGLFTDAAGEDFGDATEGFGRAVGRLSGLPVYQYDPEHPDSQRLLHLGLSGSVLYAGESIVRYRSRPESHLAPYLVDTGEMKADGAYTAGFETAWVNGPLCLQGEALHSWLQGQDGRNSDFGGIYASASWFLTGESRPYDRRTGTFGRVIPKRDFHFDGGGWGAWEVAARYSYLNLNNGDVDGGRLSMFMAGVNWYLHSHVKWRFDYGFGHVSGRQPDGNLNLFQTRLELDF